MGVYKDVSGVGVIHTANNGGLPRLRWHSLGRKHGACKHGVMEISGVPNLYYAPQPEDLPDFIRKPVGGAAHRLTRVANFLGADRMSVPGPAFCEILPGATPQVTVFSEVELEGRTFPVHLRGARDLTQSAADFTGINMVAGLCLFGNRALRFFDEDGNTPVLVAPNPDMPAKRLYKISVDPDFSLYEYESVMRQTSVITSLARCISPELSLSITLDVPRVQYYLYLMRTFDRGLVTPGLALDWFDIVDERHILITDLFRKQLTDELPANHQVAIRTSSALGEFAEVIRQRISAGRAPEAAELIHFLRDVDPLWALLPEEEIPCDLTQLGSMSYVIEELRAGMSEHNGDRRVGVMIENCMEWKIYHSATRIARFLHQNHQRLSFRMLGIYPMERLLITGDARRSQALYLQGPRRHALSMRGELVDLLAVARSLYTPAMNVAATSGRTRG